ncbi:MAG: hypothetical protein ACYCSX_12840 [Acidimicrobiales bacterium]
MEAAPSTARPALPALPARRAPARDPRAPPTARRAPARDPRAPPTGGEGRANLAANGAAGNLAANGAAGNLAANGAAANLAANGAAANLAANVRGASRIAPIAEPTGAAVETSRQAPAAGAGSRGGARTRSRGPTRDLLDRVVAGPRGVCTTRSASTVGGTACLRRLPRHRTSGCAWKTLERRPRVRTTRSGGWR